MKKSEALSVLRRAKTSHIQWRARAQALVAGVDVGEDAVPIVYTDCKFGKWYYGEGQELSNVQGYKEIEEPHQKLHLVYMEIFKKLYGKDDRSALAKLFSSKKKFKQEQLDIMNNNLLPRLVDISKMLLKEIKILESEIICLPNDVIE